MKKFFLLLALFSFHISFGLLAADAKNNPPGSSLDSMGKEKIAAFLGAAAIIYGADNIAGAIGLGDGVTTITKLSTALYGTGIITEQSVFKDYALRAPVALAASQAVSTDMLQQIFKSMPILGEHLKTMGDDAKILETLALYESLAKPLYEKFRDCTSVGQFVVNGRR